MISKGNLYKIVRFKYLDSKFPPIESLRTMKELYVVFPNYLTGVTPDRKIDFGIDRLPDRNTISIAPYQMVMEKLKQLKEQ